MSKFNAATTRSKGTVGWATQYFEPNNPFSSASQLTKRIERLGGSERSVNAFANSNTAEVPLALSSAPGWIAPYGSGLIPRPP